MTFKWFWMFKMLFLKSMYWVVFFSFEYILCILIRQRWRLKPWVSSEMQRTELLVLKENYATESEIRKQLFQNVSCENYPESPLLSMFSGMYPFHAFILRFYCNLWACLQLLHLGLYLKTQLLFLKDNKIQSSREHMEMSRV